MNRRVVINLIAFATLAVVMVIWALTNVITFDFLKDSYRVNAEFASSPGLHPGFEVDYLGVPVGKIGSVKLEKDRVRVRLDMDRDRTLPAQLSAAAARKSAVGEPYVALSPKPGAGGELKDGALIPVQDTSLPPAYSDLFGAVNKTLQGINADDAATLTHELYLGFNGRGESLRQIIQSSDLITQGFADHRELIDGLTDDLTKITHTLAQNRGSLGSGIDNLAALSSSLRQVKGPLIELRDRGPGLVDEVRTLLDKARPDLGCTIESLSTTVPGLATRQHLAELTQTLNYAGPLTDTLRDVLRNVEGHPVMNVLFVITFRHQATLEFKYPLPQPTVKPIPNCLDGRSPGQAAQIPYRGKDPQSVTPPQYRTAGDTTTQVKTVSNGTISGPPTWLVYIPPVLALLVLIKVMAGSVPVLSRIRRPRR